MNEIDDDPELATEAAAAEIRAALRLTRRAADAELNLACDLRQRVPRVWEALAAGEIDLRRARILVYGTAHLSLETARQVIELIIAKSSRLTSGQLHALLRRLCVQADPEEAASLYGEALADRRLVLEATIAGTANLLGLDLRPSGRRR